MPSLEVVLSPQPAAIEKKRRFARHGGNVFPGETPRCRAVGIIFERVKVGRGTESHKHRRSSLLRIFGAKDGLLQPILEAS